MTEIVGILNLTPDSFSHDGLQDIEQALSHIDAMIEDGASVIDIGAESTRPGAISLSWEEEWQRLAPVAQSLGKRLGKARFSIDTRHPETAQKAVSLGFNWINDVSGGNNPAMLELARNSNITIVIMHSLTVPANPAHTLPPNGDAVEIVLKWAQQVVETLEKQDIERTLIIIDPGIGFGKTAAQSLALIKNITRFKSIGVKLLVGHSRKSFLSAFSDKKAGERDAETLAVSYYLADQGVDYLRVHDVKSHAPMLKVKAAL